MRTQQTTVHEADRTQNLEHCEAQQTTALYQENMAQVCLACSTLLTLTCETCKDYPDLLAMFD